MIPHTTLVAASSLIGVLAMIGLAARVLRPWQRSGRPKEQRVLALRETLAIDPRRRLHLVSCGERQVILLTGGSQDLVIGWMPDK